MAVPLVPVAKPKRRKAISKKLRALVALQQGGLCSCGCEEKLQLGFHIDHDPALELRAWDEAVQDTIPPANDPAYLFGMVPDHHRKKTNHPRGPHTTVGSDTHAIWKGKRIRGELKAKPKKAWGSRPMRSDFKPRVRDINDE